MTRRIVPLSWMPRPSSEKAAAPFCAMSPISASSAPASPFVHAPTGKTRVRPGAQAHLSSS